MGIVELLLIAVGLSMDAFAVAICTSLAQKHFKLLEAIKVGLFFGAAQAVMPIFGYLIGGGFSEGVSYIDHWIAFGILAFIGGKMLVDTLIVKRDDCVSCAPVGFSKLFPLAIATSIDALAVGVSFAFLLDIKIVSAACIIGFITFSLSVAGVLVGFLFGIRFRLWANLAGGFMLIAIGARILIEHLV